MQARGYITELEVQLANTENDGCSSYSPYLSTQQLPGCSVMIAGRDNLPVNNDPEKSDGCKIGCKIYNLEEFPPPDAVKKQVEFGGGLTPLEISGAVPVIDIKLNGREATALVDSGASFSVINVSFVRGLGIRITPHVMEAQLADNRLIRTAGMVELTVEINGISGIVPFCIFEDVGSGRHDAVLGCNILGVPGVLLDVANKRVIGTRGMVATTGYDPGYDRDLMACLETLTPSPPLKCLLMGLLQQQTVGGLLKKHRMLLMSTEGVDEMDLSAWEYAWDATSIETYNICDRVTESCKVAVSKLLTKYSGMFNTEGHRMGAARVQPFKIELVPGARPTYRKQYRHAPMEMEEISRQVADMLVKGVIRPSKSPWCSPVTLQKKEGGKKFCLCADLRAVNEITVGD